MIALFVTVLLASLVGSVHCAGMCGAFVAFAIGAGQPGVKTRRSILLGLYQIGRLLTYAALGALAGAVGAGIDMGGHMVGLQRAAAALSGVLMIGFGTLTLLRVAGVKWKHAKLPAVLTNAVSAGHQRALRYSTPARALAIGLLTTLLPCGWLYAFVITAAGTGHAWSGAALMAAFWMGTLPMLTILGVGVRWLAAPLATRLPAITASAIVLVGVYTIVARAGLTLHGATAVKGAADLANDVKNVDHAKLPCCAPKTAAATSPGVPPAATESAKAGTTNEVAP